MNICKDCGKKSQVNTEGLCGYCAKESVKASYRKLIAGKDYKPSRLEDAMGRLVYDELLKNPKFYKLLQNEKTHAAVGAFEDKVHVELAEILKQRFTEFLSKMTETESIDNDIAKDQKQLGLGLGKDYKSIIKKALDRKFLPKETKKTIGRA